MRVVLALGGNALLRRGHIWCPWTIRAGSNARPGYLPGADEVAQKIMEVARAYGIPIVRRPELARAIFASVKLDESIPQNLYIAVAEVLAMLQRIRKRRR